MSGLLPDAGWQESVLLLLLDCREQLLLLRGIQGEGSLVFPNPELRNVTDMADISV